jgi:hypothetical protein
MATTTTRDGEGPMKIRKKDDEPKRPFVQARSDPRRVNGLVWEDRVRTTRLFLMGTVAEHPTAAVDIPPWCDIVQGLPTHVKSQKVAEGRTTFSNVEMASTLRLFRLRGHQRLVIGLYTVEDEKILDDEGNEHDVHRYHTVYELILSDDTLAAIRGSTTAAEIEAICDQIAAYDRETESLESARARFHPMTRALRKRPGSGIASVSAKLDETNNRLQSAIGHNPIRKQLETEPDYAGRIRQPNWTVYTGDDSFHGLQLPWRTVAKDRIFKVIRDDDGFAPKKAKVVRKDRFVAEAPVAPPPEPDPNERYARGWTSSKTIKIYGGGIVIMRHEGRIRTIRCESDDEDIVRHVDRTCADAGFARIASVGAWLCTLEEAMRMAEKLTRKTMAVIARELAEAEAGPTPGGPGSAMRSYGDSARLFSFRTWDGLEIRPYLMSGGNWALLDQKDAAVAARIEAACGAGGHGSYNGPRATWIVRDDPPDLIEKAARFIMDHGRPETPPQAAHG